MTSSLCLAQELPIQESFEGPWTIVGPVSSRTDLVSPANYAFAARDDGDGNPGAWLETAFDLATVSSGDISSWAALINEDLVWDPSEAGNGPIGKLDFRVSARMGDGPPSRIFTLGLRQGEDGAVWAAVDRRVFFTDTEWAEVDFGCLEAADFVPLPFGRLPDQPDHPDFSASGDPIEFGLVQGQSCAQADGDCSIPFERILGIDNFEVLVQPGYVINRSVADAWYEEGGVTDGQGIWAAVYSDLTPPVLFFSWFTFAPERPDEPQLDIGESAHRWMIGQGPYVDGIGTTTLYRRTGGVFDQASPPVGEPVEIGEASFTLRSCNMATLEYVLDGAGDLPEPLSGRIDVERIVYRDRCQCE